MFIVILHGSDAERGIADYATRFGNDGSPTFEVAVDFMATYQGLPVDHAYRIGTVALDTGFYLEIDGAPSHIGARPVAPGQLPAGIAMLSIEVDAPRSTAHPVEAMTLYEGRHMERVSGPFGEWIELLSVADAD